MIHLAEKIREKYITSELPQPYYTLLASSGPAAVFITGSVIVVPLLPGGLKVLKVKEQQVTSLSSPHFT
jgi:hypothetical protein